MTPLESTTLDMPMRSNDQLSLTFQEEEQTVSGVETLSEAARSATREVIRVSGEANKSPDLDPSQAVRNSVNDQHRAPCLPRYDSPTDKLLMRGAEALSDVELLSLFMDENTELARKAILFNFQSLRELFQASEKDFQVLGIRQQSYVQLQAVLTLSQRWLKERLERGDVLSDVSLVRDFLSAKLRDQTAEQFCVLFLDNRHRVIAFEPMFQGTIDQASVHPREVVKRALHHNAAATILAHNHPSGVAEPSQADHRITDRLKDALGLIDVRVLDHFVVGDELISFAQRGYL